MTVWRTKDITEEPEIALERWQIVEIVVGDKRDGEYFGRHFVGYRPDVQEGRVSSRIVDFDPGTQKGRTRSGRIYELLGPPGTDTDAEYVLAAWLRLNGIDTHQMVRVPFDPMRPFGAGGRPVDYISLADLERAAKKVAKKRGKK